MMTGKEFTKLFSENEELNEKMFSTGNEELDTLLEKVYSAGIEDGYEYAQKEFGEKDNDKKDHSDKEIKLGKSKRGVGRILADGVPYGPLGMVEGAIALKKGKKAAEKAAKEGKSESEVIDEAGKKAKRSMRAMEAAATGAGVGISAAMVPTYTKLLKSDEAARVADEIANPTLRKVAQKIVENPRKTGLAVGGTMAGLTLAAGAARAFRRGRLAENAAHKNTIERIKDGKKDKK